MHESALALSAFFCMYCIVYSTILIQLKFVQENETAAWWESFFYTCKIHIYTIRISRNYNQPLSYHFISLFLAIIVPIFCIDRWIIDSFNSGWYCELHAASPGYKLRDFHIETNFHALFTFQQFLALARWPVNVNENFLGWCGFQSFFAILQKLL